MAEETLVPNQSGSVSPETEPKADIPGVAEKRKPGRPPKAPPAAADANYTPSIERNNEQQAYQPTAGTGVAGYGDWDDFDESALADAIRSGQIGGAALDTFEWEPIKPDNPLLALARTADFNVLLTPHTAAGSGDFYASHRSDDYENVARVLEGKPLLDRVC